NADGEIMQANDAFLQAVRYTREDLEARKVHWKDMTPPEYARQDALAIEEMTRSGLCTPFEKECLRKDGSRVPVLIGGSRGSAHPPTGLAFVLDLTARKGA